MSPDHPLRRAGDQPFWLRLLRLLRSRDGAMFLAVVLSSYASYTAFSQGSDIQQGRKIGSALSCAVGAALTDGGQRFVAASASQSVSPKLAEFLQQYGYPSKAKRQQQATAAAKAYGRFISDAVVRQAGPRARGVVHADGKFDCRKFAALAKIPR